MSEENETSVEGSTTVEPIKDSKESTPVEKTVNTAAKKQATTRASKGKSSVKPAGVQDPNATPTRRRLPMVDGRARRAGIYQR